MLKILKISSTSLDFYAALPTLYFFFQLILGDAYCSVFQLTIHLTAGNIIFSPYLNPNINDFLFLRPPIDSLLLFYRCVI